MTTSPSFGDRARELGASDADVALLTDFKSRAAAFERDRLELEALAHDVALTNDDATQRDFSELVDRGAAIKRRISAAFASIESAFRAASGTVGDDGVRVLSSLGVWLLPGAVVLAASAVLGGWRRDAGRFVRRFADQTAIAGELERSGMAAVEAQRTAAEAVALSSPAPWLEQYGKPLAFGAVAAVGLFYLWRHFRGAR